MKARGWWLAVVLTASGCFPYAYVLPPLDLGVDVGARVATEAQTQVGLHVGTRPLAVAPSLHHRWVDFGLGYSVLPAVTLAHGPYAEVTHLLVELQTSETALWRLRAGVVGRLLFDGAVTRLGGQASARLVFEYSNVVDSDFARSDYRGATVGHALGEVGIGLYTETGALVLPSLGPAWTVSTGLLFTVPASFGVGFAWLR